MALIKCPECGGTVSDKAPNCIHCGYPIIVEIPKDQTLCSLVISSSIGRVGLFAAAAALVEVGGMTTGEAMFVLENPGSIILSHLSHDIATAHAASLSKKNIPVRIEPESQTSNDQVALVCSIKSIKFPRNNPPEIAATWKKTFPDPSSYFNNLIKIGIRSSWRVENAEEDNPPCAKISLFNNRRERIALCSAKKIDIVPAGENLFLWIEKDTIDKSLHKNAALLVLGDVQEIPTDEMSRKGVITTANDIFSESIPTCPKCGSHSIQVMKKGFGTGNAVAGALLLGPIGLAAGAIGSGNIQRVCVNCGHKF